MSDADRVNGYEKALSTNLARVLDLLKFAEAKNAALLAFASAWIVGLVNLLSSGRVLPPGYLTAATVALPLFVIAACTALISLLPKLQTRFVTDDSASVGRNLLFFGDVADLPLAQLKTAIREDHFPAEDAAPNATYLHDMEVQISINAKIARRKYRLFKAAGIVALLGIAAFAIPTLTLLLSLVTCGGRP